MARTAVIAGTATAVSGNVARNQQAKAQQAADATAFREQQHVAAPVAPVAPPPPPAGPTSSTGDVIAQLKELAALKEQGILTEAEFAAQKARVLGG